jgi:hypothetical protein
MEANVAAVAVVRRPRSVSLSQVGDCLAELSVCRKAQNADGDETKIRGSSEKGQRRLDGVGGGQGGLLLAQTRECQLACSQ